MKKIILGLILISIISSCSNQEFEITKDNVEPTYKTEDRSLNLKNKNIKNFVNLNNYMSGTEVNNIYLGNNSIQFIDVSKFPKLGKLEINNNEIRFISDLKLPIKIRHLNLSNNSLTSLKGLEKYTKLKTLDVSYNSLEDEDIIIDGFKNLKYLNIKGNNVSEEMLIKINKLNSLYLSNNKIPYTIEKIK